MRLRTDPDAILSPYLRQHIDNPVDWWSWGADAFDEATRRDVPIFLSIGYAACHWCHVMAHESFEDESTASYLNAHFVSIKVDREERPDVDSVYMAVTQALTGQGGWPMSVFLTPDREPFYAGTYFPPRAAHGMPSFPQLLDAINSAWTEQRGAAVDAARRITTALREQSSGSASPIDLADAVELSHAAVAELSGQFDEVNGGFGGAPKFPPTMVSEFLLRHYRRTGDAAALRMVTATVEGMTRGGIYDQIGGGTARYSVDATWTIPHFEKMLYDNALLLHLLTRLWCVTKSNSTARAAMQTAEFLLRDLQTAEGGFASALDADTDTVEGATYAWTPRQLEDALGATDGRWATEVFGVTESGTFEHGTSVLQLRSDPDDQDRLASVVQRLLAVRTTRPQPARDDKVVTVWNAQAAAALADAAVVFDRPEWLLAANAGLRYLLDTHVVDQRLRRVSRAGVVGAAWGLLEDYAALASALLTVHQATGDIELLAVAGELLNQALREFSAGDGRYDDTAHDAEQLLIRPRETSDNVTPAGWSSFAGALLTYAALTGSGLHREAAESAVAANLAGLPPRFAGRGLAVLEDLLDGPREVAIVGAPSPQRDEFARVARIAAPPGAVVVIGRADEPGVALLANRPERVDAPVAYVCRHFVCAAPVHHLAGLHAALR